MAASARLEVRRDQQLPKPRPLVAREWPWPGGVRAAPSSVVLLQGFCLFLWLGMELPPSGTEVCGAAGCVGSLTGAPALGISGSRVGAQPQPKRS